MPRTLSVDIRWMIARDLPEVVAIERQAFEFPWESEEFLDVLRQRNCIGMVCEHHHAIVGFMVYQLHKSRLQILNMAVHPDHQRCGVGTQMIERLKDKLHVQRRTQMGMEIRERNIAAQLFLQCMGFAVVAQLHGVYEDSDEDCYAMQFTLNGKQALTPRHPFHPRNRISKYIDS